MKTLFILLITLQLSASEYFDATIFEKAKKEHKIILLNLKATWCHWCHVMDQTTYQDTNVQKLLNEHFIYAKVDHDARPDLAQKYREYGWPATIFFDASGREIAKRSGYIAPDNMARLLQAIIADPSPEQTTTKNVQNFSSDTQLSSSNKATLIARHNAVYDDELGGLKIAQKFLEIDSIEYSMHAARFGDTLEKKRAIQTLDSALKLIDSEFGGAYQYSTHYDWLHPHYEKIIRMQARYIKTYALAAKQFNSDTYLKASQKVAAYVENFLTDKHGAFYVSQDADLEQGTKAHTYFSLSKEKRLALGLPHIDTHLYSSSQGAMIEALCYLYEASGDTHYLTMARKSANWTLFNRLIEEGGFSHSDADSAGPYLEDNLNMLKALIALYRVSGKRQWLKQADFCANFIVRHFKADKAGLYTNVQTNPYVQPVRNIDENIQSLRSFTLMYHYSGKTLYKEFSTHIMHFLLDPETLFARINEDGILLADYEYSHNPLHLSIIGDKQSSDSHALQGVAFKHAPYYSRIDIVDLTKEEPMNNDLKYPNITKPAGFACNNTQCSAPAYNAKAYTAILATFK